MESLEESEWIGSTFVSWPGWLNPDLHLQLAKLICCGQLARLIRCWCTCRICLLDLLVMSEWKRCYSSMKFLKEMFSFSPFSVCCFMMSRINLFSGTSKAEIWSQQTHSWLQAELYLSSSVSAIVLFFFICPGDEFWGNFASSPVS